MKINCQLYSGSRFNKGIVFHIDKLRESKPLKKKKRSISRELHCLPLGRKWMEFLIQYHVENNSLLLNHYYGKALNTCCVLNSHQLNKARASFIKGSSFLTCTSEAEASEDCENWGFAASKAAASPPFCQFLQEYQHSCVRVNSAPDLIVVPPDWCNLQSANCYS